MTLAIGRGIPVFNIGGGPLPSRFTQKFGGGFVSYSTYRKNFLPLLDTASQLHRFIDAVSESIGARNIARAWSPASLLQGQRPQNVVVRAIRKVRGNPGEMFVLLSALMKYVSSKIFSTFACRRTCLVR
jgi:hypothetical protein